MLSYDLGEMKSADGSPLRCEVELKASGHALRISDSIRSASPFKALYAKLPSERTLLYFQYIVKREIYPFVLKGCVIRWYNQNNRPIPIGESVVRIPRYGIFGLLAKHWDIETAPIKLVNSLLFTHLWVGGVKQIIKQIIEQITFGFDHLFGSFQCKQAQTMRNTNYGTIACHYVEGIDTGKRNDINWYAGSGIPPEKVLIYLDSAHGVSPDVKIGKRIKKEVTIDIEKMGFRWIALQKNVVEDQGGLYWRGPRPLIKGLLKNEMRHSALDRWLIKMGNDLLRSVHYWRAFYDDFGVIINYIPEELMIRNFPQAIAFDVTNGMPGLLMGKQRSEVHLPLSYYVGSHPKHVLAVWNDRFWDYLMPNHDKVKTLVITGFPYDILPMIRNDKRNYVRDLREQGAKFIVTLFDNAHGHNSFFSTNEMANFYSVFLEWALADKEVGIVIKSKKPIVLNKLPAIRELINTTINGGGRIRIEDEAGRLPADAAFGADMVVGIGISSALIEAVIAGGKGVLYDVTNLIHHEFYTWGNDKLIFTDLRNILEAFKRYKEDPEREKSLGDWSRYLYRLDSFMDGKGCERMGSYMRFLLEAFDGGKGQSEACDHANKRYTKLWGKDKVLDSKGAHAIA